MSAVRIDRDVAIPTRDGSPIVADVFGRRPATPGEARDIMGLNRTAVAA